MLKNRGKIRHFVENTYVEFVVFNQMWKIIHRTHGGDAILKKSFKKPLTCGFENDILIKLTAKNGTAKDLEN